MNHYYSYEADAIRIPEHLGSEHLTHRTSDTMTRSTGCLLALLPLVVGGCLRREPWGGCPFEDLEAPTDFITPWDTVLGQDMARLAGPYHGKLSWGDGEDDDLLGVPRRSTFSIGTREAGTIVSGVASGSVRFETIFSTFGELAGYPVFGAQLEIGVTRRGELSRIGVSAIHATEVGMATVRRGPVEAVRMLEADVAARNPRMLRQETVMVDVGFISPEGPSRTAMVAPALVVDYVVLYPGDGTDPMVSRRQPAWVSLISDAPPYPRHHPDGAVDDAGDPRNADLDDP